VKKTKLLAETAQILIAEIRGLKDEIEILQARLLKGTA